MQSLRKACVAGNFKCKYFILQKKEPVGDDESIPDDIASNLDKLTSDILKGLTVTKIKRLRTLIDEAIERNNEELLKTEKERNEAWKEVSNIVHESVPISDDEVW